LPKAESPHGGYAPDWSVAVIPTPADPFEEWLRLPVEALPADSPYEVRRALPDEFPRLWDVVDEAFGVKRPRPLFDWLYRANPYGTARCWIVVERKTGDLLKTGASFPWPVWRGSEPLLGALGGDAATLPHWQRRGLSHVRNRVRRSHPWFRRFCAIAGPNAGSRAVIRKDGRGANVLGRLRAGVALLQTQGALDAFGLPTALGRPLGALSDAFFAAWPGRRPPSLSASSARVERVARFTTDFDEVTLRHMAWPEFWCPHNAEFLNWRYLDHPTETYVGLAVIEDERPSAYAVVRLAGRGATLAELAVERRSPERSRALLVEAMALAREAGCAYLNFFATPRFPHWGTLRSAGFLPYVSKNWAEASCPSLEPDVQQMRNWQILPGDRDYH
jgi:hypothetical protein